MLTTVTVSGWLHYIYLTFGLSAIYLDTEQLKASFR